MARLFAVAPVLALAEKHPIRQTLVDRINQGHHSWQAAPIEQNPLANYSLAEIKGLMGLEQVDKKGVGFRSGVEVGEIPTTFDGRSEFSSCQKSILDQANCGSCWAFGAAETLTTNLCVLGLGNPVLAPQDLVSCDASDHGCNGGTLPGAWGYIDQHGLRSESCMPYSAGEGDVAACAAGCTGGGDSTHYKCPVAPTNLNSDQEIQAAVMTVGAVEVGFFVMEDFMNYKSGIYSYKEGLQLGGHAVKIVGWGQELDTFYWIVQNSWGPAWGENGFFRIKNWHDDKESAFAIAGGYACLQGATPAPPAPPPTPVTCKDIVNYCGDYGKSQCEAKSYLIPVCQETCGCCDSSKPSYCGDNSVLV